MVAFEGIDEGLGHPWLWVLRTGVKSKIQPQGRYGVGGLPGDVGAAIVAQLLHPMRSPGTAEPALDRCDHQITVHFSGDPSVGDGKPANDFAVAGIDDNQDPHDLAVTGTELQVVRTPAHLRAQGNDHTVMGFGRALRSVALQRDRGGG